MQTFGISPYLANLHFSFSFLVYSLIVEVIAVVILSDFTINSVST